MTDYTKIDLFGGQAQIRTGLSGEPHWYKIVGNLESNAYCDVPVMAKCKPYVHDGSMIPIVNVIHYGVSENEVIRVPIKDCERIVLPRETGGRPPVQKGLYYVCPECGNVIRESDKHCPQCGLYLERRYK